MARAALLMLTVYDEVGVLVPDPVVDVVLALDVGAADAEPDVDATDEPAAAIVF